MISLIVFTDYYLRTQQNFMLQPNPTGKISIHLIWLILFTDLLSHIYMLLLFPFQIYVTDSLYENLKAENGVLKANVFNDWPKI